MKPVRLTLVCHALTRSQQIGRFHHPGDAIQADAPLMAAAPAGMRLLCAPELRARQTAAWLGEQVRVEPALADCDMGDWQGVTLKHLQRENADGLAWWQVDAQATPHRGESFQALYARVDAWLQAFDEPGDWMAVTHPSVIRAALLAVLGAPLHSHPPIDVLPCARLHLSRTDRWRLRLTTE